MTETGLDVNSRIRIVARTRNMTYINPEVVINGGNFLLLSMSVQSLGTFSMPLYLSESFHATDYYIHTWPKIMHHGILGYQGFYMHSHDSNQAVDIKYRYRAEF